MRSHFLKLLIVLSFFVTANGSSKYPGLFGKVVNVADDDTLNVRIKPNYRSKKIGALPPGGYVGVDYCKKIKKSTWCKIFHIPQRDYDEYGYDAPPGWVNARYLSFSNRGYVLINNKPNCDYALRCKNNKCEIVVDYKTDSSGKVLSIKTKWVNRENLKGSNHFGAMNENEDGYCNIHNFIYDYLRKQNNSLKDENAKLIVKKFIRTLSYYFSGKDILPYIHPKRGVTMTYFTHFDNRSKTFNRNQIKNIKQNRHIKIYWGKTETRGDKVYISLYNFMHQLRKEPFKPYTKIKKLNNLKGFTCKGVKCIGYEALWIGNLKKDSSNWHGVVIILEKYQGKWYIVGLLRDRWTI